MKAKIQAWLHKYLIAEQPRRICPDCGNTVFSPSYGRSIQCNNCGQRALP